MLQRFAG